MDVKVLWTETARNQLEDISDYYKNKVSKKVAKKILNQIFNKALVLEKHPLTGQVEQLLISRKNEYRYLIEGRYKIIYWIEGDYVRIAAVFDCRQNPKKNGND